MNNQSYEESVFINCPFDNEYQSHFEAIIFAVHDCGFIVRSAREVSDSSQVRIIKIMEILSKCRYGIHDISRTDLDKINKLPRFNMPLELGLFLGAKQFGNKKQKDKLCLILDTEPFRYQKFCSDISGQDISAHENNIDKLTRAVRDWLNDSVKNIRIPTGSKMAKRYHSFEIDLPLYCDSLKKIETN